MKKEKRWVTLSLKSKGEEEAVIQIGGEAPDFKLPGVIGDQMKTYSLKEFRKQWVVLFFYPADFSFICPTEVKGFSQQSDCFYKEEAKILGVSVDSPESHREWAKELKGLRYPLLSDSSKEVCKTYHVLDPKEGVALRATFLIDPSGKIQYSVISPFNVGRSVEETLRVLQALRTGRMCPAGWKPDQPLPDSESKF
ncbi:MAG: redoxin domain-containing protein [Nitrospiria bacterium]